MIKITVLKVIDTSKLFPSSTFATFWRWSRRFQNRFSLQKSALWVTVHQHSMSSLAQNEWFYCQAFTIWRVVGDCRRRIIERLCSCQLRSWLCWRVALKIATRFHLSRRHWNHKLLRPRKTSTSKTASFILHQTSTTDDGGPLKFLAGIVRLVMQSVWDSPGFINKLLWFFCGVWDEERVQWTIRECRWTKKLKLT